MHFTSIRSELFSSCTTPKAAALMGSSETGQTHTFRMRRRASSSPPSRFSTASTWKQTRSGVRSNKSLDFRGGGIRKVYGEASGAAVGVAEPTCQRVCASCQKRWSGKENERGGGWSVHATLALLACEAPPVPWRNKGRSEKEVEKLHLGGAWRGPMPVAPQRSGWGW